VKLTESQLKQIVQEEIDQMIEEGWLDRLRARASGAGRGARGVGQRLKGIGKYAAAGEAPSTKGAIGGGYAAGKAGKIITLHQRKLQKVMAKAQAGIQDRLDDFKNDVQKLGLDKVKTDVFQDLYNDITEVAAKLGPKSDLGQKLAYFSEESASFGEPTEFMPPEKKPAAPERTAKAGARMTPAMA